MHVINRINCFVAYLSVLSESKTYRLHCGNFCPEKLAFSISSVDCEMLKNSLLELKYILSERLETLFFSHKETMCYFLAY